MADPKKRDGANVAAEHDAGSVTKKQRAAGEEEHADAEVVAGDQDILAWLTDVDAGSVTKKQRAAEAEHADSEETVEDDILAWLDLDAGSVTKKQRAAGEEEHADADEIVGEDILAWLTDLDADSVAELMSLLDPAVSASASAAAAVKVRFIDNPYSSPLIYKSSCFVTINGNEESCGSSFSGTESLMLSVDTRGVLGRWNAVAAGASKARGGDADAAEGGENAASFDYDDAMLARFLGEDLI